jgi:CRISPR/Cas system-associated exonuclease Cas4 (RecB family)
MLDAMETKKVKQLLTDLLTHPQIAPYFQKGNLIKKETELYDREKGHFIRPDRVVLMDNQLFIIDYKTGETRKSHQKQLEQYAAVYARMGYRNIEKILIYLSPEIHIIRF